jgi:DNA gyrase subunit A
MFATAKGIVRRNSMDAFTRVPTAGKIAMRFGESDDAEDVTDRLIGVSLLTEEDDVLLATKCGRAIRFAATDVREFQSRTAAGVRGARLQDGDEVISLSILKAFRASTEERDEYLRHAPWRERGEDAAPPPPREMSDERFEQFRAAEEFILTVCANGYGKRSSAYEYRRIGRGGQGITNIGNLDRNGPVVASFPAHSGEQLMLVTDQAKLIRMSVGDTRVIGRGSAGVRLFVVAPGEHVVSAARIDEDEEPENEAEEKVAEELASDQPPVESDTVHVDDGTGPETLPLRDEDEDGAGA